MTTSRKITALVGDLAGSWWPIVMIALLTSLILFQRWQMTHPHPPQLVREGQQVKGLRLRTLQKDHVSINFGPSERGAMIYFISPDCVWCERNTEAVSVAYQRASQIGYRFISISLKADGLKEYLLQHKVPFPIYVDSDRSAAGTLKVAATPETIFISPSGVVQKVIMGAYKGKNASVLQGMLGLTLPEIPALDAPGVASPLTKGPA